MMNFLRPFVALTVLLLSVTASMQAGAVSTYARQTGMPCAACHFQNFPALNQFGRSFKANGYAFSVAVRGSEGPVLSLRDSLNAGIITKIRYQQSNGSGPQKTNDGEFQFPDELLLNIGTRISNNIGAVVELDLNDGDPLVSGLRAPWAMLPAPLLQIIYAWQQHHKLAVGISGWASSHGVAVPWTPHYCAASIPMRGPLMRRHKALMVKCPWACT
jgi:hypothetical protein